VKPGSPQVCLSGFLAYTDAVWTTVSGLGEPGKNVFKLAATPLDTVMAEIRDQLARERE
jgi:hypothetical protein